MTIRAVATPTGQAITRATVNERDVVVAFWSRWRVSSEPACEQSELWPLRDAGYVARLRDIPRKSVLQCAREGGLPCVRIGRHVRFVIADVQAVIDAQRSSNRRD